VASSLFILGGVRSGKSRFALAGLPAGARVAFVATAEASDADMADRIARHQAERPPHWTTIEASGDLVSRLKDAQRGVDTVIVDCLTLWVANMLLRGDEDEAILGEAAALAAMVAAPSVDLRIVSNEVGLGVHPTTPAGLQFGNVLGLVNQRVAAAAQRVVLLVAGLPLLVKDTPSEPSIHASTHEAP
jgi:adenosylcobinamide kinase/adenosylcobinamide-phosphate guanylyltransferase